MYAIIRAGGKQQKVAPGDVIEMERLKGDQTKVEFTPLLVVDDKGKVNAGASSLDKAKVTGQVVGESRGDKIQVLKFRNKTGYRRRAGHRQRYTTVQISDIALNGSSSKSSATKTESTKTESKRTTSRKTASKKPASTRTSAKKPTTRKTSAKADTGKSPEDKE